MTARARLGRSLAVALASLLLAGAALADPDRITLRLVAPSADGAERPRSFEALVELIRAAERGQELALPLPVRLDGAFEGLVVREVGVSLDPARRAFALAGRMPWAGRDSELVLAGSWRATDAAPEWVLGLRPAVLEFASRATAVRGTDLADLALERPALFLAERAWGSFEALGGAGTWFDGLSAPAAAGWSVSARVPVDALPLAVRRALGATGAAELALAGRLEADAGLLRGTGAIRAFELRARASSAAPPPLPALLAPVAGGARELVLALRSPGGVSLELSQELGITIAGERRRMRCLANASSSASLTAESLEPWHDVLGLDWLDLSEASLTASASSARVEGRLDLAGQRARVSLALEAGGVATATVAVESLAFADLMRAGVLDALPAELAEPVQACIGERGIELREVSLTFVPATRVATLAARTSFLGAESEFLYATTLASSGARAQASERGAQGERPGTLLAFRPARFSLGRLLGATPPPGPLAELAALDLDLPVFHCGALDPQSTGLQLPDTWRDWLARTPGAGGAADPTSGASSAARGGLRFGASLPRASLPSSGALAELLALVGRLGAPPRAGLELSGSIGREIADLELSARLADLAPSAALPSLRGGGLALSISGARGLGVEGRVQVELGGDRLEFLVASKLERRERGSAAFEIEGALAGPWRSPFGLEGLELEDVRLRLGFDAAGLSARCAAALPLGSRRASVELALGSDGTARLSAALDRATLGDLVQLARRWGRGLELERSGLDSALTLTDLGLSLHLPDAPRVVAQAGIGAFGRQAELLVVLDRLADARSAWAVAVRAPGLRLSQLAPALAGSPADLELPEPTFTRGSGWGAEPFRLTDPELAAWTGGAELVIESGLRLSAAIPLAAIPERSRAALGLPGEGTLELSGSIEGDLALLSGHSGVRALELRAALPAAAARPLPRFLTGATAGGRSFVIDYAAPSSVSFGASQEVEIELGGRRQRWRLTASADTDAGGRFRAESLEPWRDAFGLDWLDLTDGVLEGDASGAALRARVDLAGRAATASIHFDADGPTRVEAGVEGLSLAELARAGVIGELPESLAGPLESVLDGAALELRRASIALELASRRLTLAATVSLRQSESHLLYVTEIPAPGAGSAPRNGERNALLALRPTRFSLGALFPRLSQMPELKELAGTELELPVFVGGTGALSLGLPEIPESWRPAFTGPGSGAASGGATDSARPEPGSSGWRIGGIAVPSGLGFRARLPSAALPRSGSFAAHLSSVSRLCGIELAGLELRGSLSPRLEDLRLTAALPPLAPRADLPWLKGGELALSIGAGAGIELSGRIQATVHGEELAFIVGSSASRSAGGVVAGALRATLEGRWQRPLGIEGLELADVQLELASAGAGLSTKCVASLALGARSARAEVVLDGGRRAALAATLDRATLADVIALFRRGGRDPLARAGLDGALELSGLGLSITAEGRAVRVLAGGRATIAGADADLLVSVETDGSAPAATIVALRLSGLELARLAPALRGSAGDLRLAATRLTFGAGWSAGERTLDADAGGSALDLRRWMPAGAAQLEVPLGLRLSGALSLAGLPAGTRQALGVDSGAEISFEGALDGSLAVLDGSAPLRSLELRARLPRGVASGPLPDWIEPIESGARVVALHWEPDAGVRLQSAREVEIDLAGSRRRFELSSALDVGPQGAGGTFEASLRDPWPRAFGIQWLTLDSARVRGALRGAPGAKATLSGAFQLAGKPATIELEFTPGARTASQGELVVRTPRLSLDDLSSLGIVERLPLADLAIFGPTAPELTDVRLALELGATRSFSLAARTELGGVGAELALALSRGPGSGATPLLVLRPERLTLGRLAPPLLGNEFTRALAEHELTGLLVLAGAQASSISAADLPASFARYLPSAASGSSGGREAQSRTQLTPGLNLLAPLSLDRLPSDGALAAVLARLHSSLGVDLAGLSLRGSLGRSAADLSLAVAFPPIEPRRAPAWLKSGELALVVSGKPSLTVEGAVEVEVDGERLRFLVSAGLERKGAASPAIQLRGALESGRPWKSPFGIEWLELDRVGLGIAVDATGSTTPSFSGRMTVGSKDLEVAAKVRISAAGVPIGGMFLGKSEAGFALADLVALQSRIASAASAGRARAALPPTPIALLPDVALRGVELKLAPRDEPDEHVEQGLALAAELFVPARRGGPATRKLAALDVRVDREGLRASGALAASKLGPLELERGEVSVVVTRDDQHLSIRGAADLFGERQALDLRLARDELSFDARARLCGKWVADVHVEAPFDLERPNLKALGDLPQDLLGDLRGAIEAEVARAKGALEAGLEAAGRAVEAAQARRAARQKALADLRARLEKEFADAQQALQRARDDATLAKHVRDEAYDAWQRTPDSKPALKAARKKAYDVARAVYEVGSASKKAIQDAREASFKRLTKPADSPQVRAGVAEVAKLQTELDAHIGERDLLQGALQPILDFRRANPNEPLLELHAGSFELGFEALAAHRELPVDLELRWLDRTMRVKGTLSADDLARSVRSFLQSVFPRPR